MNLPTSPVFDLMPPVQGKASLLVFASPHSGVELPQDMQALSGLSEGELNSACDVGMDQMIAPALKAGVPILASRISRAYVDLNRAQTDLDPELISDLPLREGISPKVRAGYGVVPRLNGLAQPLYDRRLSCSEVERRLERVYRPYHQALATQMQAVQAQYGRALLIDWHSMPQRATGKGGADVVLGDRFGTACAVEVTRHLQGLFEALGWKVALNRPYAGGYATQTWGRPLEGFEAIQVELSRRLYWDEVSGSASLGWRRCQTAMKRVIQGLSAQYRA